MRVYFCAAAEREWDVYRLLVCFGVASGHAIAAATLLQVCVKDREGER